MHPNLNRMSFDPFAIQPPSESLDSSKATSKSSTTTHPSGNTTTTGTKAHPTSFSSELEECIAAIVHKTKTTTEFFEQISRPATILSAIPPDFYSPPSPVTTPSTSLPLEMAQSMNQLDERINGVEADLQELRLRISSVLERL